MQQCPFLEADKHNWTKEERIAYDNVLMKETDEKQEKIKADEIAKEKGKEEGKEEKEIEFVLRLHSKGINPPEISDLTGLPLSRVLQIIENQPNK